MTLLKKLIKFTLGATLVVTVLAGGTLLLAGPSRSRAMAEDLRQRINSAIDESIDDPAALRSQLRELEKEYPRRIRKVSSDLASLRADVAQIERERRISLRVVELADEDLAKLDSVLEEASQNVAASDLGPARARLTAVVVGERAYTLQGAQAKRRQIENTRNAHAARAADAEGQLVFLRQQEQQFAATLAQLEAEQAQFSTQLQQLNVQVDSIQRNERLIELLNKRKRTLEECASYDVASLDQLTGKLQEILTRQTARLDQLTASEEARSYEEIAREETRESEGPLRLSSPR